MGAPITWTTELIEAEAQALFEWLKSPTAHKLLDFCNEREILVDELYYFADISPNFSRALKMAKQNIAANREDMVNKELINYGAYNRYVSFYDPMIHQHERSEKVFDSDLKKKILSDCNGNISVNIIDYSKS